MDLSSGGWRPRQAAVELAGQLGVVLPPCEDNGHGAAFDADEPSYAGIIGSGVDAEARGERPVITAFGDARAIATHLEKHPRPLVILAPRFGFSWREDNIWLVRFLSRLLPPMGPAAILVAP